MLLLIHQFIRDAQGVTAVEYSLIATFIAVPALAAFSVVGTILSAKVLDVSTKF